MDIVEQRIGIDIKDENIAYRCKEQAFEDMNYAQLMTRMFCEFLRRF